MVQSVKNHLKHSKQITSRWFQPIWKIWSSNWIISPIFGMKIQNIFELPPPRCSMYGAFTYIYPLKLLKCKVNRPYIECLGTEFNKSKVTNGAMGRTVLLRIFPFGTWWFTKVSWSKAPKVADPSSACSEQRNFGPILGGSSQLVSG